MNFVRTDGGRSKSKRPRQSNDCTVIAAAIACGVTYDEAYDALAGLGRKSGAGFWLPTGKRTVRSGVLLGHQWAWHGFPTPARGEKRPKVWSAVNRFSETVVLRVSKHVIAVKDGAWYDQSRAYEHASVYGYWTVERA